MIWRNICNCFAAITINIHLQDSKKTSERLCLPSEFLSKSKHSKVLIKLPCFVLNIYIFLCIPSNLIYWTIESYVLILPEAFFSCYFDARYHRMLLSFSFSYSPLLPLKRTHKHSSRRQELLHLANLAEHTFAHYGWLQIHGRASTSRLSCRLLQLGFHD